MKIVVIGGTGLIGSRVVTELRRQGHDVLSASPASGIDILTGEGLADALTGADVVVDVANSPSFEDAPALDFFTRAGENLLAVGRAAGVSHYVALSVVGTDRLQDSGYFRAKLAQEALIRDGGIPFTIVRATQFFEFVGRIADSATQDGTVRITSAASRPMAADDVATAVAGVAVSAPADAIIEVCGPELVGLDELVSLQLRATGDDREVVTDRAAPYFGVVLDETTLVAGAEATVFRTRFADWLADFAPVHR
ncbi:SDR family oxidoreductase [Mycolicibacterium sp. 22603]|uniref:SDR family oxidoreductase n=1 Tax=Mycolicibacterium sp. 22603 TaxID=3453950 RepID=UPI003F835D5F